MLLRTNDRESASSLTGSLERGLAPLSQCECLMPKSSLDTYYTTRLQMCFLLQAFDASSLAGGKKKKKTFRENVGLLGSTRIGSRRVIQIAAGFMIFFSVLGEQNKPLFESNCWQIMAPAACEAPDSSPFYFIGCREIWSLVRFHPVHHLCGRVLRPVRASWLVILFPS